MTIRSGIKWEKKEIETFSEKEDSQSCSLNRKQRNGLEDVLRPRERIFSRRPILMNTQLVQ